MKRLVGPAAAAMLASTFALGATPLVSAEEQQPQEQQQEQQPGKTGEGASGGKPDAGAQDGRREQGDAAQPAASSQRKHAQPAGAKKRAQEPTAFVVIVPVPAVRPVADVPDSVLAPDVEQIRDTLASATEAALTPGGFDDLMERFVDADRNRMGRTDIDDKDFAALDGSINQIRQAWQSKYGSEFDIDDERLVFGPFPVVQGEIADHARSAATASGPANQLAGNDPGDVNLEPGRNIALLSVPQAANQPELSVLLIHEFPDSWKIDVPDTVSGRDLRDKLGNHLRHLAADQAHWPATEAEAYRHVAHHVLAAVMGDDVKPGQRE